MTRPAAFPRLRESNPLRDNARRHLANIMATRGRGTATIEYIVGEAERGMEELGEPAFGSAHEFEFRAYWSVLKGIAERDARSYTPDQMRARASAVISLYGPRRRASETPEARHQHRWAGRSL